MTRTRLSAEDKPLAIGRIAVQPAELRRVTEKAAANLRVDPDSSRDPWWVRHVDGWTSSFPNWPWARLGDPRFNERMAKAVHFARAVERYAPDKGNVTLLGSTGVGKTLAVVALANRLRDAVISGPQRSPEARMLRRPYFVRVAELARSVREHSLGSGVAPNIRRAMEASWLVLDDLGNEPPGFESMLLELVDERYWHQRVTFATSGYTRRRLSDRYGDAFLRRLVEPRGAIIEAWPAGAP